MTLMLTHLSREDWDRITADLAIRADSCCEVRSPVCRGPSLAALPRLMWSIHHRKPRGMGGTSRADVHALSGLLLVCGSGSRGCHAYVERHRTWAFGRGFLVEQGHDPTQVPLILWSGRRVMLDESPFYSRPVDGGEWVVDLDVSTADTPTRNNL